MINFFKAPVLRNSLPQYIKLFSSFAAFENRITPFYHGKNRNMWHLHGSNPSAIPHYAECFALVTAL